MTSKVHDTNLMLLVFLDFKEFGNFSLSILSHDAIDTYFNKLTFQCGKFILMGQVFHTLLADTYSLTYN